MTMQKHITISPDKKQCVISGEWFDCLYTENPRTRRPELIISDDPSLAPPLALFKNITKEDLPSNSEINIKIRPNQFFKDLDYVTLRNHDTVKVSMVIPFYYKDWNKPWNLNHFLKEMEKEFNGRYVQTAQAEFEIGDGSHPDCNMVLTFVGIDNKTVESWIIESLMAIKDVFDSTEVICAVQDEDAPLKAVFSFPQHLEKACEQYLIYFGEFLTDLGISADVQLREVGKNILFSVSPDDKEEALKRVKSALAIYLKLPNVYEESKSEFAMDVDPIIQRHIANIEHLRSQLRLSEAVVRLQASEITSIRNALMSTQGSMTIIIENSLDVVNTSGQVEKREEFFCGALKFIPWKKGPIEIDAGKIVSSLKRLFGGTSKD